MLNKRDFITAAIALAASGAARRKPPDATTPRREKFRAA